MLRLFMGLILILGLAACQDEKKTNHQDVANTSLESSQAAVHSKMDKAPPVLNETNAQDVKKKDMVPVEISSATINDSSSVADAIAIKKEAVIEKLTTATIPVTPVVPAVAKKTVVTEKIAAIEAPIAVKKEAVIEKVAAASTSKGNAEHGKTLARRCLACHNFGMKDKVGPHLAGVFNRAAGQSGFGRHSAVFKSANWTWDEAHLLKWVCDSKAAVKEFTGDASARTKMPAQKVCGTNGDDLVAYLKTL